MSDIVERLRARQVTNWVHATGQTPRASGKRTDPLCAAAADEIERLRAEVAGLRAALGAIDRECYSHVDGRDLFAQMHPRNTLDIKRRVDARETWFDGDWLTDLWTAIKAARAALAARKGEA